MNYKKATYIVNTILILVAAYGLFMIRNFSSPVVRAIVGPGYYPTLLCVALIVTLIISLVKTFRSKDNRIVELPKIKNALLVIVVFVAFLVFWRTTRQFYIVSFISMGVLLHFLNPQSNSVGKVIKSVFISLAMQVFVYFIFEKLMYFRF